MSILGGGDEQGLIFLIDVLPSHCKDFASAHPRGEGKQNDWYKEWISAGVTSG